MKFPVGANEDELKYWRAVKGEINAKCRAFRFAQSSRVKVENSRLISLVNSNFSINLECC